MKVMSDRIFRKMGYNVPESYEDGILKGRKDVLKELKQKIEELKTLSGMAMEYYMAIDDVLKIIKEMEK